MLMQCDGLYVTKMCNISNPQQWLVCDCDRQNSIIGMNGSLKVLHVGQIVPCMADYDHYNELQCYM